MLFRSLILAGLSLTAIAAPALADDSAKGAAKDPDRQICHKEEQTGSLMVKRVCHTAAEWAQIKTQNKADVDRMNDHNREMVGTR